MNREEFVHVYLHYSSICLILFLIIRRLISSSTASAEMITDAFCNIAKHIVFFCISISISSRSKILLSYGINENFLLKNTLGILLMYPSSRFWSIFLNKVNHVTCKKAKVTERKFAFADNVR